MNIRRMVISGAACLALGCMAQQMSPLTKAMLDSYKEILAENPKDYDALYQRALQYYQLSMYDNALFDIVKALEYTPAKEKAMRADEFDLLSDIYIETKEYEKALEAVDNAMALSDDNYALLYKRGNVCLYLNKPEVAYDSFRAMQRLKSRSQEAFFGMARADIMMGKLDDAREMMSEAEKADPSNYITFCRIGDLYREMNEDEQAASYYLSGFSLSRDELRPLQSLIDLGNANFGAVKTALDYALSRSDNKAPLYFLLANIAYSTGNYTEAYDAFKQLLSSVEGREWSVYGAMAQCCLALDKLTEAKTYCNMALGKHKWAEGLVIKSRIDLAAGDTQAAIQAAKEASAEDPESTDAIMAQAKALIVAKDWEPALRKLNEVILVDPQVVEAQYLKAYVNGQIPGNSKQAVLDAARVGQLQEETFPNVTYKALGQYYAGKKLDADETVEKVYKSIEHPTKDDYYWMAVYYAQSGDLTKAKTMIDKALQSGYQNYYNVYSNRFANLNLAPISHLLPQRNESATDWKP